MRSFKKSIGAGEGRRTESFMREAEPMRRWKTGLWASLVWVLIVVAAASGMVWYISSHPFSPAVDDIRHAKAGALIGASLVFGLSAIWAWVLIQHLRHKEHSQPSQASISSAGYAACPACSATNARKVTYTWWGGLLGPKLFHHVKCQDCGVGYNGETGRSNMIAITVYLAISGVAAGALLFLFLSQWWS